MFQSTALKYTGCTKPFGKKSKYLVYLAFIIYSCIFHHKQNNRIIYFGPLTPSHATAVVGLKAVLQFDRLLLLLQDIH